MDGFTLTSGQITLIITIAIIAAGIGLVFWIFKALKRKFRSVKRTLNSFMSQAAGSGLQKLSEYENRQRQERLSTNSGSSETQGYKSDEVRMALREQNINCSSCGAPNKSVEVFCPYCGTNLIKQK